MTTPRHLIYHVTPIGNWGWNLNQLLKRQTVFNGVKLIAIAQGKTKDGKELLNWQQVRKHIPLDIQCVPVENDPVLRETASLPELLRRLHAKAPSTGITFYAHTKGTSRGDAPPKMQEAIRLWTEIMYSQCLDRVNDVEKILETHTCCGAFKRYGRFGHFPRTSHWHYSGTFFWFRNKDLFEHPNWQSVPRSRYGAEAYLSTLFNEVESGCIFGDGITDLYNVNYLRRVLQIKDGTPMRGKKNGPGIPVPPKGSQTKPKAAEPEILSDIAEAGRGGKLVFIKKDR
jgi:hypothetical protein